MVGPTTFGYQNLGFAAGGLLEAGSLELIETKVISTDATADFTSLGTYKTHFITYNDLRLNDNHDLELRVFVSGSIVDSGTAYERARQLGNSNGSFSEDFDNDMHTLKLSGQNGENTGETTNGFIWMHNAVSNSDNTYITWMNTQQIYSGYYEMSFGQGKYSADDTLTGIRFYPSNNNLNSGEISLYGLAE